MKPNRPIKTYPTTQPSQSGSNAPKAQSVSQSPPTYPANQPTPSGNPHKNRPPLPDLGTPASISTIIEYLLYIAAAILFVLASLGIASASFTLGESFREPTPLGPPPTGFAMAQLAMSLLEICFAVLLAAAGIGLNHLRYAATALKCLYMHKD